MAKSFPVTADQVVIFGARLRASIVGIQFVYDGTSIIVADDFADTAQVIYNQGFAPTAAELAAYAASVRYDKETAGITANGVKVATDRQSQAMISGAFSMAQRDASFTTKWKADDGTFVPLDAPTIISLATAVGSHVAACFGKEADVAAGIIGGTVKTYADIDAAFAAI